MLHVRYRNDAVLNPRSATTIKIAKITKNSAAFFAEIGYDFFPTKYFTIGLQTAMFLEFKKGKLIDPENMSHIDVSLGFKFYNL